MQLDWLAPRRLEAMSGIQKTRPFKIVLLGDVKVGKSSLINKYQQQNPTVSLPSNYTSYG